MSNNDDCPFCGIVAGEIPGRIVFENDDVTAFLDANPLAPGHTLVVPNDHHERLDDLSADLAREVFAVLGFLLRDPTAADWLSNPLEALIEDPTGSVTRVRVGSYMGRNFGRVVEVSSDQIALVEIVPDGQDGWVERSRNISLAE